MNPGQAHQKRRGRASMLSAPRARRTTSEAARGGLGTTNGYMDPPPSISPPACVPRPCTTSAAHQGGVQKLERTPLADRACPAGPCAVPRWRGALPLRRAGGSAGLAPRHTGPCARRACRLCRARARAHQRRRCHWVSKWGPKLRIFVPDLFREAIHEVPPPKRPKTH